MKIKYAICISLSFANYSLAQLPDNSTVSLKSAAISKYSIRANSDDKNGIIPLGVFYQIILREVVRDKGTWEFFNDDDIKVLMTLHAPQSKFFLQEDMAEIDVLCGALPTTLNDTAIMNIASRFSDEKNQSEIRVQKYYEKEIDKLSLPAQKYIEARIEEIKSSGQVGYGSIDIQGMAEEFPNIAYELFEGKCLSHEASRQKVELKDMYFVNEEVNYSAIIEE